MRRGAPALAAILAAGCGGSHVFHCLMDEQCDDGATGQCEPTGFCSYADPACPGGQRYADHAGDGLSGQCVGDVTTLDARADGQAGLDADPTPDGEPPLDGARPPDGPGPPDAPIPPCPGFCTSCTGTICVVDCSGSRCTGGIDVTCPAGWTCQIDCVGSTACELGVVACSGESCVINCIGTDACDVGGARCSAPVCDITCSGSGACEEGGACCNGGDCGAQCTSVNGGNCSCF
jgi:hypothetical protein